MGPWWRLVIPLALMGAIVSGWIGTIDAGTISVSDELLHFTFYGVLTFAWVFALGWGLVDEAFQSLTNHRTASVLDAGADVLGAAAAAVISLLLWGRVPGLAPSAARK